MGRSGRGVAQLGKSLSSSAFEEGKGNGELGSATWDEAGSLTRAEMRRRLSPSSAPKLHNNHQLSGTAALTRRLPRCPRMRLCWMAVVRERALTMLTLSLSLSFSFSRFLFLSLFLDDGDAGAVPEGPHERERQGPLYGPVSHCIRIRL